MEEELIQQENQDISPEEAKASLGLATRLGDQYLMSQAPPMEEPQEEPQEEKPLSDQYPSMKEDNDEKLDQVLEEIQSIKDEIKAVLEDEEKENGQEE